MVDDGEPKYPDRARGGTETVAVAAAVGAGLSACLILLTLFRPLELQERVVALSVEAIACVLLAALSWGIFRLKRWAWIVSLVSCGAAFLVLVGAAVLLIITSTTGGLGRPHGVTATGEALLFFLLPLGLLLFGTPQIVL